MYLRQSCFDGWLNNTKTTRRCSVGPRQGVYMGFSRRKIPRSLAYTIRTVDWWSKRLLLVALSQDGHTQSILWRPFVANFISVKNLPWRCRRNWCYWVVHLPVVKERLFNCSVTTVSFFMLSVFSILVKTTWLNGGKIMVH